MYAYVQIKECLFILMGANVQTGHVMEGWGEEGSGVLKAYGRDVLRDNGKRLLLSFATNCKLVSSSPTRFSARAIVGYCTHTTASARKTVSGSTTS